MPHSAPKMIVEEEACSSVHQVIAGCLMNAVCNITELMHGAIQTHSLRLLQLYSF